MKATAVIYTATGTTQKGFAVEAREGGKLFCPALVEWATSHADRTSNLLTIITDSGSKIYHL